MTASPSSGREYPFCSSSIQQGQAHLAKCTAAQQVVAAIILLTDGNLRGLQEPINFDLACLQGLDLIGRPLLSIGWLWRSVPP